MSTSQGASAGHFGVSLVQVHSSPLSEEIEACGGTEETTNSSRTPNSGRSRQAGQGESRHPLEALKMSLRGSESCTEPKQRVCVTSRRSSLYRVELVK